MERYEPKKYKRKERVKRNYDWKIRFEGSSILCPFFEEGWCGYSSRNKYCAESECKLKIEKN